MISRNQMLVMLNLQDKMNATVNPDWRKAGYNWCRAIMVEAVEAMEHFGWKWWKKQTPDMPQVRLELVDIFHFMLSQAMVDFPGMPNELLADMLMTSLADIDESPTSTPGPTLLDYLQTMVNLGSGGNYSIDIFHRCLIGAGMTWEDLYSGYIGKNTLNLFRQANGYKVGTYIKDWSKVPLKADVGLRSLEDNDHLHEIMLEADLNANDLQGVVMAELQKRYITILEQ